MTNHYDLAVIGSGPAGQKAAIQGAKLGKRVAIIDRSISVGGVCLQRGAIPSKTLREAVLHYTGYYHRQAYNTRVKRDLTLIDLMARCSEVVESERQVVLDQLDRNRVEVIEGHAYFIDPHKLKIQDSDQELSTDLILIATGTIPTRPDTIPFEKDLIVDADGLIQFKKLPRSLVVVGAGVIGAEYASILALLNTEVTLIDQRPRLLEFVDEEITEALSYQMRDIGLTLYFNKQVISVSKTSTGKVQTTLEGGKKILSDALLYAVGRHGSTDELRLETIGIKRDTRGRILVNEHLQTNLPHVYAAGDVIGCPSLASTSMEQGRLAACHAFGISTYRRDNLIPYGIYTVPEISMVGENEKQLTRQGIPYEIGIARYREIARGEILGDQFGMLKLLFHQDSLKLLGVHIIGQGATELIHIGQAVMAFDGTIDYFIKNTFNYPTLAECYRVAALDGYNKGIKER